jgi:ABC-type transport system involved in multi-copper enzyme maturation permease subunit
LWSFIRNLLFRGKEARGRRARTVWNNPVAWREAATRAGFSGRGIARWVTILAGTAAAVVLLVFYHRGDLSVEETRRVLMALVIVEFSVSLLVATNTSAAAVTKERESQTLDLLLVTPITSRYYIWGKLRGLVSFMLPFAAVPTITIALVVLYDVAFTLKRGGEWVVFPENIIAMPLLLTALLAWACMLGLQLSLKWSRTIVAVMASVGMLAGICAVLGVCGFTAASSFPVVGVAIAAFSPFTAIAVMICPTEYAALAFTAAGAGGAPSPEMSGRLILFFAIIVASGTYCAIVWVMYKSMVKNFDMIIRRQHQ